MDPTFLATIDIGYWWWGIISYAVFHLVHLLWWRVSSQLRDPRGLFIIFFILPIPFFIAALIGGWVTLNWIPAICMHLLLGANYISFFPIFDVPSPTAVILWAMKKHPHGFTEKMLFKLIGEESLVSERMQNLVDANMVRVDGEKVSLTLSGNALATFFVLYRKLLGLPPGVG